MNYASKLNIILLTLLCLLGMDMPARAQQKPWITNESRPYKIGQGLAGHHLAVWPSHGRYYSFKKDVWEWQRPQIFGTTEDLLTQTIVIPYLIPMLENAGANVFVPRERDWQTEECLVDNDQAMSGYNERNGTEAWTNAPGKGFGIKKGRYRDGDRPFAMGSARMVKAVQEGETAKAYYRPNISKSGSYAVYVSYQTTENSVDDAEYIVVHQGQHTKFRVNQRMGSGTWVYLGTFEFDRYSTFSNYVMVTNNSRRKGGVVTTDAVRFGGGMGSHERGGRISHLPRAMECARYYAQYAGAPKAVIVSKGGSDDYGDDINTRSLMSNWLSYGSRTNPTERASDGTPQVDVETTTFAEAAAKAYLDSITKANIDSFGVAFPDSLSQAIADSTSKAIADSVARIPFARINVMKGEALTGRVPLELQLAIHTDAGWQRDFSSPYGSLGICTRDFNDNKLASGQSRGASFSLACDLVYNLTRDLKNSFGKWETRDIWDKNYSETRLPAQPSAILEALSHENFPDIRMAHDPYFKFVLARSVYKTLLKFLTKESGEKAVVQPLPPHRPSIERVSGNAYRLTWSPQSDSTEKTATPDGYILYTRIGDNGYDNGTLVKDSCHTVRLRANTIYRFKVAAYNKGGESFPTEELVAMYNPEATETVMIVNGFHRLSSPTVLDNDTICGFDLDDDIGLSYGKTLAWCGHQKVFSKKLAGRATGLGYTNDDLLGRFTAGNDFNYSYDHAVAISKCGKLNIVSMSSEALRDDSDLTPYSVVDVLLGNEKNDGHSLLPYKTFTNAMRSSIQKFSENGGRLLVSGSYVASDMKEDDEQQWLADNLHISLAGTDRDSLAFRTDSISDMVSCEGLAFSVFRHVNADHYASVASDVIIPSDSLLAMTQPSFMQYASGRSAAVAYRDSKTRTVTLGFPFDCIKEPTDRNAIMRKILDFLLKE